MVLLSLVVKCLTKRNCRVTLFLESIEKSSNRIKEGQKKKEGGGEEEKIDKCSSSQKQYIYCFQLKVSKSTNFIFPRKNIFCQPNRPQFLNKLDLQFTILFLSINILKRMSTQTSRISTSFTTYSFCNYSKIYILKIEN